jgi:hypothetical protein
VARHGSSSAVRLIHSRVTNGCGFPRRTDSRRNWSVRGTPTVSIDRKPASLPRWTRETSARCSVDQQAISSIRQ